MEDKPALVIDSGGYTTKAGFASDDHPRCIFQSVVGRPKHLLGQIGKEHYEVFIGDDATCRSEDFALSRPMGDGYVNSWDNMERLWHHAFYRELRVAPEEGPILMSCVPQCPLAVKEKTCEIMFETFNAPSLFLASSSLLSLFSTGRNSGVVVDSGHSATHISPVDEGSPINCAYIRHELGGKHMSQILTAMLEEKNHFTDSWSDQSIVEDIKRGHCFVSEAELCSQPQKFTLPDGSTIMLNDEIHSCTETMFRPSLMGYTFAPLPHDVSVAVSMCDADVHDILLGNIVVCGGNSMTNGFVARVEEGTRREMGGKHLVRAHAAEEAGDPNAHAVTAWCGGSLLAGMSGTQEYWLSKKLYAECGPKIIKSKFM